MREIKFRAWNSNWKMMLEVLSIDFAGGLVFVQPLADNSGIEEIDLEDVDLLQYTEMKDCNDVEIYEGDIIRVFDGCKNKFDKKPSVIEFDYGAFQPRGCCLCDLSECEVIGNIYENPELMEG